MPSDAINWAQILLKAAGTYEDSFKKKGVHIELEIDSFIVTEIKGKTKESLMELKMKNDPNVAKVAGHLVFWIRKLKPVYPSVEYRSSMVLSVNEHVALLVGLAICREYSENKDFSIPKRVLEDFAKSLRYHSHSPHSCAITFECLISKY